MRFLSANFTVSLQMQNYNIFLNQQKKLYRRGRFSRLKHRVRAVPTPVVVQYMYNSCTILVQL